MHNASNQGCVEKSVFLALLFKQIKSKFNLKDVWDRFLMHGANNAKRIKLQIARSTI